MDMNFLWVPSLLDRSMEQKDFKGKNVGSSLHMMENLLNFKQAFDSNDYKGPWLYPG